MTTDHISVNTQSSIRIADTKVLYFDPFQIRTEDHDADVIFVTHSHYDHLDPDSISGIRKADTVFVAPVSIEKDLQGAAGGSQMILMQPGETRKIGSISVQAVPAYNRLKPFHPKKNGWLGYIVEMNGTRYYVAGDTDAVPELQEVKCDIALVPIGGTYTMTAKDAARLISHIRPEIAIPTHYGSIVGKMEDAAVFEKLVDDGVTVVTKL